MEFVALMDVQDTRPHWLEKLITSNCTVLSTYSPQNLGLPIAGGLLHSASDSGMCGTPWAPVGLRVVNAQQQPTPIGVSGQAMLGSLSTGSFLRWRADGQLHYLGEQGQELDAVRAALHVVPVAKSTQQASTATEQAIARVWEALLGIPGIGPQDNFFDLGGTSLLAMQAMTRLEAELGRRISAQRMVFDSLGQLAAAYDASTDPAAPACVNNDPASNTSESGLIKKLTHLLKRA
jgi:acyl carrier protein